MRVTWCHRPGTWPAYPAAAAESWTGQWVAADPTNRAPAGERQVVVARGRDYPDVAPLTGIYHGAPSRTMQMTVEVTRLA